MSDWLAAALLGVVQGFTEFLPISSSGHLVLAHHLLGFKAGDLLFDVVLHLATLIAVLWVFGGDFFRVCRGACSSSHSDSGSNVNRRILVWVVLGSVPAALVGFFGKTAIAGLFDSPLRVAALLVGNGLLLLVIRWVQRRGAHDIATLGWPRVVLIGVGQALAILPGVSRSGTTISLGLMLGMRPVEAARFSFFLFIPAVLGATLLEGLDLRGGSVGEDGGVLLVGFVVALLTGIVALRWLLKLLKGGRFHRFGYYCIGLGLIAFGWFWQGA